MTYNSPEGKNYGVRSGDLEVHYIEPLFKSTGQKIFHFEIAEQGVHSEGMHCFVENVSNFRVYSYSL